MGAIAAAGLFASTTEDLGNLVPVSVHFDLQLPGLVVIGLLCAFALRDITRTAIAFGIVSIGGALLYGLAIASAGLEVERAAVRLMNRGLIQGMAALLIIAVFVLVGMAIAVAINVFVRQLDNV